MKNTMAIAVVIIASALVFTALSLTGCPDVLKSPLDGKITLSNNSPKVGDTITATYTSDNGNGTETWQWFRVDTENETVILNANTNTYTVTADDIGKKIKVTLSFANQAGSLSAITTDAVPDPNTNTGPTTLTSITADYASTLTVYQTTPLDDLKTSLIVTANYSNNTTQTVTAYTLSGTLVVGTSTIIVSYEGKTTTFTVRVIGGTGRSITYDVVQTGGADNTTDSTGIVFTFSASVDGFDLTADDITVGERAEKDPTVALTGSGTTWTLSPITVTHAGEATVRIAKPGIEAGIKHVTVYKQGEIAPTLTGITAVYNSTTIIYPTTPLNNLKANLTVKAQYSDSSEETLSAGEYSLSVSGGGTLTVGPGAITVTYTHDGVTKTYEFTVTVSAPVLTGIVVTYNGAAVDPNTPLNSLKNQLTVIAAFSDGSIEELSAGEYSLTGPLADGINTITVSYTHEGVTMTDEFTVSASHDYQWEVTKIATATEDGKETRACSTCSLIETRPLYATGTAGLQYDLIDGDTAYRVHKGTTSIFLLDTLHIPSYWRPLDSTDYDDYRPVTQIGNGTNTSANNAFGGTNAAAGANSALTEVTFAENSQLTTISAYAFQYCLYLEDITIPASVTSIGNFAFQGCTGLASVTIPEGVTTFGNYAFSGCTSLASVTIPASITTIGNYVFNNCSGLTSVILSEGVTTIGSSMFYGCAGLASITIPASITSMGNYAFQNCTSLASVNISEGVTSMGNYVFQNCTSLASITIPGSVTSINNNAFQGCTGLASITISEGVTSIGERAFYNCAGLASITIPASVTTIGSGAFYGCASLTSITVDEGNPNFAGDGGAILYNKDKTKIIAYPSATGSSVTIPEGVTSIGDSAFRGSTGLTSVTIPDGVTSIETYAFQDCTGLTSITIPDSVTSIGTFVFQGCTSLTSVNIPEGVTSIGMSTFERCPLTSIEIPASVTSIALYAFSGCSSLTSVTFATGSQLETIGTNAFQNTSLESITIPAGVTSIGGYAFYNCNKLTTVTIPNSVTEIGGNAFQSCTSLTSINIPASVTSIGTSAFNGCNGLTEATIAAASIGSGSYSYVFYNCTKLATVTFTADVQSISNYAFDGCSALASVTFEGTIASGSFSTSAFPYLGNLRNVFYSTDSANGTPGTYIVTSGTGSNKVWTLQEEEG